MPAYIFAGLAIGWPDTLATRAVEDRDLLAESDRTWLYGDVLAGELLTILYPGRPSPLRGGSIQN